ncbi:uncharacterized protein LOC106177808 [Lingula anatina]|uniref:Uncharacterized protein LOC106177808 n=1 Tax=Lingula anatina TaxID=7574 RepID=A0A1S3K0J3_LINAN|nr:uncharacterized protein LOC106177808 [Lingula anatina]|eukprot:XP_013416160.1 uncharacterized protein LOC106177808 [Lingula anatina]
MEPKGSSGMSVPSQGSAATVGDAKGGIVSLKTSGPESRSGVVIRVGGENDAGKMMPTGAKDASHISSEPQEHTLRIPKLHPKAKHRKKDTEDEEKDPGEETTENSSVNCEERTSDVDENGVLNEEEGEEEEDEEDLEPEEMQYEEKEALYKAVCEGDIDEVEILLDKENADINMEWFSENLLVAAIRHGKEEMAEFLLDNGVDRNFETSRLERAEDETGEVSLSWYSVSCRQMAYDAGMHDLVELIDYMNGDLFKFIKPRERVPRIRRHFSEMEVDSENEEENDTEGLFSSSEKLNVGSVSEMADSGCGFLEELDSENEKRKRKHTSGREEHETSESENSANKMRPDDGYETLSPSPRTSPVFRHSYKNKKIGEQYESREEISDISPRLYGKRTDLSSKQPPRSKIHNCSSTFSRPPKQFQPVVTAIGSYRYESNLWSPANMYRFKRSKTKSTNPYQTSTNPVRVHNRDQTFKATSSLKGILKKRPAQSYSDNLHTSSPTLSTRPTAAVQKGPHPDTTLTTPQQIAIATHEKTTRLLKRQSNLPPTIRAHTQEPSVFERLHYGAAHYKSPNISHIAAGNSNKLVTARANLVHNLYDSKSIHNRRY